MKLIRPLGGIAVLLGLLILRCCVPEPVLAQQNRTQSGIWWVTPHALTTTPTAVCSMAGNPPPCSVAVWACQGDVNAAAGTAVTITITDNQGTPVPFWPAVAPLSTTVASAYKIWEASSNSACRYFPLGMIVSASANSTINFEAGGVY